MKTVEKIHRETDGTVQSLVRALRLLAVPSVSAFQPNLGCARFRCA